jgi:hypothetical protein
MKYSDAAEINSVIASLPGWKERKTVSDSGMQGSKKGFEKGGTFPGTLPEPL